MIINREHFHSLVALVKFPGAVHDQVNDLSALTAVQVFFDQLAPPAGVDQVVETNPGNPLPLQEVENLGDVLSITAIDGEPEPHFDPRFLAVADASQGGGKCSFHSPEPVVGLFHPVQAHAHIGESNPFQSSGHLPGDQGPIRGDDRPHTPVGGQLSQIQEIFPQKRLASGEEDDRGSKSGQVFDERLPLLRL